MKAGQLRHRIEVYQQDMASDGCGGFIERYILRGLCWSEVKTNIPVGNNEQFKDRKITSIAPVQFKTRHNIGFSFDPTDIIKFKDQIYRIQGISNALEHDFKYSLFCYQIENNEITIGYDSGLFNQQGDAMFNQDGLAMFNQQGVA